MGAKQRDVEEKKSPFELNGRWAFIALSVSHPSWQLPDPLCRSRCPSFNSSNCEARPPIPKSSVLSFSSHEGDPRPSNLNRIPPTPAMADARSLLRQQRAARRITHPHAAYSDTGKLLCTLCREPVKAESLWDAHIAGETHRKRQAASTAEPADKRQEATTAAAVAAATSHKRKHDGSEDVDMVGDDQADDDARRKRAKSEATATVNDDNGTPKDQQTHTPPDAARRSSQTPSQGVELQIPSRPATPRDSSTHISSAASSATATSLPSRQLARDSRAPSAAGSGADKTTGPAATQGQVDEDEWAAFEAEIAAAGSAPDAYADATISGAAVTAEEAARKRAEDEGEEGRRRASRPEADLADEKEDAKRALEEELDEMRDLEAKVLRLKERRDALRQRAASHGKEAEGDARVEVKEAAKEGKENSAADGVAVVEEGEDESDEESGDEEDEDDWDGFRFRTR